MVRRSRRVGNVERLHARRPMPWFVGYLNGNPVDARRRQGVGAHAARRSATSTRTTCAGRARGGRVDGDVPAPAGRGRRRRVLRALAGSRRTATSTSNAMAEAAVDEMHLGTEDRTDFLGVSFSIAGLGRPHLRAAQPRGAGHAACGSTPRIGRLLDYLDKKVGADNYVRRAERRPRRRRDPGAGPGRRPPVGAGVRAAIEAALKPALGGEGRTSRRSSAATSTSSRTSTSG